MKNRLPFEKFEHKIVTFSSVKHIGKDLSKGNESSNSCI